MLPRHMQPVDAAVSIRCLCPFGIARLRSPLIHLTMRGRQTVGAANSSRGNQNGTEQPSLDGHGGMNASLPTGPVKLVILPRTRTGLGRAGLRRHLETIHGPMVVGETEVSAPFTRYVHHYTRTTDLPLQMEERDAVTFIHFDSMAGMIASKASEGYRDRVGPDEDNFREVEGSIAGRATEKSCPVSTTQRHRPAPCPTARKARATWPGTECPKWP